MTSATCKRKQLVGSFVCSFRGSVHHHYRGQYGAGAVAESLHSDMQAGGREGATGPGMGF